MRKRITLIAAATAVSLAAWALRDVFAAELRVMAPLRATGLATFQGPTTVAAGAGFVLNWGSNYFYPLETTNLIGLANTPSGARLDVTSSGSGKVQIWRNSGGTEVANMSDAGQLSPTPASTGSPAVAGSVAFFNTSCPSGWTELTGLAGRYLVAATASIGTSVGTALSNLENRSVGLHNHSISNNSHNHATSVKHTFPGVSDGTADPTNTSDASTGSANSGVTVSNSAQTGCTTTGTNAPYVQFRLCQKN